MGIFVAITVLLAGIYASDYGFESSEAHADSTQTSMAVSAPPVIVRVTGYGAYKNSKDRKSESKRLMVLRASKLDAYRNLAERIYGTTITGSTTVKDFQLKNDGVASMVDSVVRGAKVVSITEHKDKGVETVLELILPGDFQDCLNKVNNFANNKNCFRAMPQSAPQIVNTSPQHPKMDQGYYLQ